MFKVRQAPYIKWVPCYSRYMKSRDLFIILTKGRLENARLIQHKHSDKGCCLVSAIGQTRVRSTAPSSLLAMTRPAPPRGVVTAPPLSHRALKLRLSTRNRTLTTPQCTVFMSTRLSQSDLGIYRACVGVMKPRCLIVLRYYWQYGGVSQLPESYLLPNTERKRDASRVCAV